MPENGELLVKMRESVKKNEKSGWSLAEIAETTRGGSLPTDKNDL